MKILAIDTSGKAVSAAVAEDARLRAHFWIDHGRTHAEALMPCVDAALAGLGLEPCDFDAFAAIAGPGSFTGLRIGLSVIKAFAFANESAVIGVSTLDALAKNLEGRGEALLCPLVRAREGFVYQAIYRVSASGGNTDGICCPDGAPIAAGAARVFGAELLSVDGAVARLKLLRGMHGRIGKCIFNGDAAAPHFERFKAELRDAQCVLANERDMHQNAASAALLACGAYVNGLAIPPEQLVPQYLNEGYAAARGRPGAG